MPEPERTALYRLYDADGELLYIGISRKPEKRFEQHAACKNWWHLVARKVISSCPTEEAALRAEEAAITAEQPLYDGTRRIKDPTLPRFAYDDSADREALEARIRRALATGEMRAGSFHWAKHVAERYGFSTASADLVMDKLSTEGLLIARKAGFSVPA